MNTRHEITGDGVWDTSILGSNGGELDSSVRGGGLAHRQKCHRAALHAR
jgi:hypothetical protein